MGLLISHYDARERVKLLIRYIADTINSVATGDVWLGTNALGAGLVDRVITSDESIGKRILEGAKVLRGVRRKMHLCNRLE